MSICYPRFFFHKTATISQYVVRLVLLLTLYINLAVAQEAAIELILDVPETGEYGWSWGTRANRESVEALFQNTQSDITLSVRGYDIDSGTEVSVLLNGTRLGYLSRSSNNSLGAATEFFISSDQQIAGTNQLSFVQRVSGWRWGVTDILLETAVPAIAGTPPVGSDIPSSDFSLDLDVPETGEYGWSWGTRANRESVEALFQNTQSDITLSVRGYDIDSGTEVSVLLNGTRLGYLSRSSNNSLGAATEFFISSDQQIAGTNQLSFVQRVSGWRWGVTDILLETAVPAIAGTPPVVSDIPSSDFSLDLDVPETGEYGWSWGTRANRESVEALFQNTQSDITLSVRGYDIDNGTEVAVLLNGMRLGYLSRSGNNALGDATEFFISSDQQLAGTNQLSFVQRVSGWKWGVTDILLESAVPVQANTPPIAANDAPSTPVKIGDSLTINVLSNDSDDDGFLDVSSVVTSMPTEAVALSDGTVVFTPAVGTDTTKPVTFTYIVEDDEGVSSNQATVTVIVTETSDSATVTILPIGDSITNGGNSRPSYRRDLWQKLQQSGYDIDFVGSKNTFFGNSPPASEQDFDLDHEGHWAEEAGYVADNIDDWLTGYTPDIVLMHLGTNDFDRGQSNQSTLDEYESIVASLRADNPIVTILIAEIIPMRNKDTASLNAAIRAWAPSQSTTLSPVLVVDHYTGYNTAVDSYDNYHPNAVGEEKIASRWFDALQSVLEGEDPLPVVQNNASVESNVATGSVVVDFAAFMAVNDDDIVVPQNGSVVIDVLANDTGPIGVGTVETSIPHEPMAGFIDIDSATGAITYTPNAGQPLGEDSFGYRVRNTDLELSNVATVSITIVEPSSQGLSANDDSSEAAVGESASIVVSDTTFAENDSPVVVDVGNVVALHRSGQTFITWEETAPLDGYHVYRHSAPISASNLSTASKLTTRWGPLDSNTSVNSYGSPHAPTHFVIEDSGLPLSDDTGLFVYTIQPGDSESAYYAVTVVRNGVESIASLLTVDEPVSESVQTPRDVLTVSINGGSGRLYTQYMDYSQWNPTFNGYIYNYTVALPPQYDPSRSYPLIVEPHAHSEVNRFVDQSEYDRQVISLFPYDPGESVGVVHSWWYGYAADHNYKTDGSIPSSGVIENFTEQRVIRAIDELRLNGDFNVNDQLIHGNGNSMGASAVVAWTMRYPSVFSGGYASQPMTNYATSTMFEAEFVQLWGSKSNNLPIRNAGPHRQDISLYGVDGVLSMGVWDWMNHRQQLVDRRGDEIGYLMTSHGKRDSIIDWGTQGQPLVQAFTDANVGFSARNTGDATHTFLSFDSVVTPLFGFDITSGEAFAWRYPRDLSFPSIRNASGSSNVSPPDTGDDEFNLDIQWATSHLPFDTDIVDTTGRYEITLRSTGLQQTADITPRRTQQFNVDAGQQCHWATTNRNNGQLIDSGLVEADIDSLVTVNGVSIATGVGTRLIIDCESGQPIVLTDPVNAFDPADTSDSIVLTGPTDSSGTNELLVNPDFSNQLAGWGACNSTSSISVVDNAAVINGKDCVLQSVDISQYQELQFSCGARRIIGGDSNSTFINFVFQDEAFQRISSTDPVQVTGETFSTYTTSAVVPTGAHFVDVVLYTTNGATVNFCSLTAAAAGADQAPQPEPPVVPEPSVEPEPQVDQGNVSPTSGDIFGDWTTGCFAFSGAGNTQSRELTLTFDGTSSVYTESSFSDLDCRVPAVSGNGEVIQDGTVDTVEFPGGSVNTSLGEAFFINFNNGFSTRYGIYTVTDEGQLFFGSFLTANEADRATTLDVFFFYVRQ